MKAKLTRIERWRARVKPSANAIMRKLGALARRKKLPCVITPEDIRK